MPAAIFGAAFTHAIVNAVRTDGTVDIFFPADNSLVAIKKEKIIPWLVPLSK